MAGLDGVHFAVSHTTRKARPGEVPGRDYHFVAPSEFDRMIDQDRFLEWAVVHGNRYGTSRAEVEPRLRDGWDVLLDIDVQGAARLLSERRLDLPESTSLHSIFILPPTFAALRDRLVQRGSADPEEVERRLAAAHREISQVDRYQYVIVNSDADVATRILASIILDKRYRRLRMAGAIRELLDDEATPADRSAARQERARTGRALDGD
jgi:guanylate kinase